MGGNLRIGNDAADKIKISSMTNDEIEDLKKRIKEGLVTFFNSLSKFNLFWIDYTRLINDNEVFSGSSKHFFSKPVTDFRKVKKMIGDIDVQFPSNLETELVEFIDKNSGKAFGKLKLIGLGGHSPIQTNTLFKDEISNLNIQIDFEPTEFKGNVPDKFAKFSRSSDWNDLTEDIKGVFHKYLIRSLVARERISNIFLVTSYNSKTHKWRVSKKEVEGTNLQGFSVDKGVRVKYERLKNVQGVEFFVDKDGNEYLQQENGTKPAYTETDTKTYDYIKDVSKIANICFGSDLNATDFSKFSSFIGTLSLINKFIPNDVDYIEEAFFNLIFGKDAQEIEQGSFEDGINYSDFNIKMNAYKKMMKELFGITVKELKEIEPVRQEIIRNYYRKLEEKKYGEN